MARTKIIESLDLIQPKPDLLTRITNNLGTIQFNLTDKSKELQSLYDKTKQLREEYIEFIN